MRVHWMLYAGRALALCWAGFWLWFGIASGIGEKEGIVNLIIHVLMPGGIGMLTALAAWRWARSGGALLAVEGLLIMLAMAIGALHARILLFLILALPPFVAGLMILRGGWRRRTA